MVELPTGTRGISRRWLRKPGDARGIAATALVTGSVIWIAFENGGFPVSSWAAAALAVWWTIALGVAVGVFRVARLRGGALPAILALAALAILSVASAAWGSSAEAAVGEGGRVLLYLGVLVLTVVAVAPGRAVRWSDGLALATTATGVVALATRFFPGLTSHRAFAFLPIAATRLNYPLGYWNALAVFVGMGVPLLLRAGLDARPAVRAASVGILPAIATTIYLTSSRTGTAIAVGGVFVFFLLIDRRLQAAGAIAAGAAGSVAAVALIAQRNAIVNGSVTGAAAVSQGRAGAIIVGLACVATAAVHAVLDRFVWQRLRRAPRREAALAGVVVLVAVAAVVASHPVARFRTFRAPAGPATTSTNYVQQHLFSVSGNGRWQFWQVAWREFRAHPGFGGGAGSFAEWWTRERPFAVVVHNAHSLYVEVLAELGTVGLALIAGCFAVGLVAGVRRLVGAGGTDRATGAAVTASFAAFVVALGFDWLWQIAAIGICGMVLLGLLVGAALREDEPPALRVGILRPLKTAVVVLAVAAIVAEATLLLADERVRASQAAFRRGAPAAAGSAALQAAALEPWASSPYLQLALVREQQGNLDAAAAAIARAIARDPGNWELWFVSARIDTERARIAMARRSLHEARRLNPLGPIPASGTR